MMVNSIISPLIFYLFSYLADFIGRKLSLQIASFLAILSMTCLAFLDIFVVKMFAYGLALGLEGFFTVIFTIVINETSLPSTTLRSKLASISFAMYALGSIALAGETVFIDTATRLAMASIVVVIIGVGGNFYFILETPLYYLKHGKMNKVVQSLQSIALRNGLVFGVKDIQEALKFNSIDLQSFKVNIKDRRLQGQEGMVSGFKKLLSDKDNRMYTLVLSSISATLYLNFYGSTMGIDRLGLKNIHINGAVLGLSAFIGYSIIIPFSASVPRVRGS